MARLASVAKAGFYPTPDRAVEYILNHLERSEKGAPVASCRIVDPCAGYGVAVAAVANKLQSEAYGIELDQVRAMDPATGACTRLNKVLPLDYNAARVSKESFSLLYLNPPYDVNDDKDTRRLEYEFLKDTTDWLIPGGVLVYIIPQYEIKRHVARYLTTNYANVRAYKFPEPEYQQFKQIVVFGIRKETTIRDEEAEQALFKSILIEFGVNLLPVLSPHPKFVYPVPESPAPDNFQFRSSVVTPNEAIEAARAKGVWYGKQWQSWLEPRDADKFQPLMPLKKGHLAMLIASGMMQNLVLEQDDERILVKGRTYKTLETTSSEDGKEEHTKDKFVTEIVSINLKNGKSEILNDPIALSVFVDKWQDVITQKVMASYEPRYKFDYSRHAKIFATLSRHRKLPGRKETGLFDAQKHVAAAFNALYVDDGTSAILVGEMGVGKTTISSAVVALLQSKSSPTIVMCPPHLVQKWLREIRDIIPNSFGMELRHIRDVDEFFRQIGSQQKGTQCFAVVSRELAKLGSGWRPAYRIKRVNYRDPFNHNLTYATQFACPKCGTIATDINGSAVTNPKFFDDKRKCRAILTNQDGTKRFCGEPFYQTVHLNEEKKRIRYPIADYIARKYYKLFKFFIADEVHELKSKSTDQGYAFGALVRATNHTLALTGTLYGGYASSLFFILHRLFPKFRRMYKWNETQDFVARYGVLDRVTKYTDDDSGGYGKFSGRKRSNTYLRELPGISPELAMLLLDATAFLSIKDLGFQLPPFDEYPEVITMEEEQGREYRKLDNRVKSEMQSRMAQGDMSLLSAYLQSTLGYPNSCFREEIVTDPKGRIVTKAPAINHGTILPKEAWLERKVEREIKEGRRVLIFCRQTGTRDITEHLVQKLSEKRIKAIVLPSSVASNKREEWVSKRVKEGYQVLITNPNLVKTGLDLIAFPTILFYELDYSIVRRMAA